MLIHASHHSPVARRPRISTQDFQESRAKLSSLYDILDESPHTRAELVSSSGCCGKTENAQDISPGRATRRGLAVRPPNISPAPAAGGKRERGFASLSALLEQSPQTRVAATNIDNNIDSSEAEIAEMAENSFADMNVSVLVDENREIKLNFTPVRVSVSNNFKSNAVATEMQEQPVEKNGL